MIYPIRSTARVEAHVFQCKTLEKRRYLDFPSDRFHDGKSLVAATPFRGAEACLTWKHLRRPLRCVNGRRRPFVYSQAGAYREKTAACIDIALCGGVPTENRFVEVVE